MSRGLKTAVISLALVAAGLLAAWPVDTHETPPEVIQGTGHPAPDGTLPQEWQSDASSESAQLKDSEIPRSADRTLDLGGGASSTEESDLPPRRGEVTKNVRLVQNSARAGEPDAAYELAALMISCAGEERVIEEPSRDAPVNEACEELPVQPRREVADWLRLAAERGDAAAQYELATLEIAPPGEREALLLSSAAQNFVPAQLALARQHDDGNQEHMLTAYTWYQRAAQNGSAEAGLRAAQLEQEMPRDIFEEARRRFR